MTAAARSPSGGACCREVADWGKEKGEREVAGCDRSTHEMGIRRKHLSAEHGAWGDADVQLHCAAEHGTNRTAGTSHPSSIAPLLLN